MTGLVVRGAASFLFGDDDVAGGAELHLLERVGQIAVVHHILRAPRGQQGGLVHQVREVRARHSWCRCGQLLEIDVLCERHLPRVNLQNLHAAFVVGRVNDDLAVESPRSQQSRVEDVWPVRGGQNHDALVSGKAVHLGENLIEGLFALVMTADRPRTAARAADGVDFVDEDDRRRNLSRLAEELTDAARPHTDDHLDELRRAGAEEGHPCFTRGRAGQQCLAGPWSAGQQHTLRRAGSETTVLVGVLQEIDNLVDLRFHFVDAGDIVERDADGLGVDALLLPPSQQPSHGALLPFEHPLIEADQEEKRRN